MKNIILFLFAFLAFSINAQETQEKKEINVEKETQLFLEVITGITQIGNHAPFNPGNLGVYTRYMFSDNFGVRVGLNHASNVAEVNSAGVAVVANLMSALLSKKDVSKPKSKVTVLAGIGVDYNGFNTDDEIIEPITRKSDFHPTARIDVLRQITDNVSLMLSVDNTFGIKEIENNITNTISKTNINFGVAVNLTSKNKKTIDKNDTRHKLEIDNDSIANVIIENQKKNELTKSEKIKQDSITGTGIDKKTPKVMNFGDNKITDVKELNITPNKEVSGSSTSHNNIKKQTNEDVTHPNDKVIDSYEVIQQKGKSIMNPIYFAFDSDYVDQYSRKILKKTLHYATENKDKKIILNGYASRVGASSYNLKLSKKRAEAVRKVLIDAGIDASRIIIKAHGESMSTSTKSNDSIDRRVDIKFE